VFKSGSKKQHQDTQCVPLAIEPGISLAILPCRNN